MLLPAGLPESPPKEIPPEVLSPEGFPEFSLLPSLP
jgi:hypothetical protein